MHLCMHVVCSNQNDSVDRKMKRIEASRSFKSRMYELF